MTPDAQQQERAGRDQYPNIPPHIRDWMQTDEGWQRVTQIVLDALNDTTNVVTNVEVREIVEEAYRRRVRQEPQWVTRTCGHPEDFRGLPPTTFRTACRCGQNYACPTCGFGSFCHPHTCPPLTALGTRDSSEVSGGE